MAAKNSRRKQTNVVCAYGLDVSYVYTRGMNVSLFQYLAFLREAIAIPSFLPFSEKCKSR